MSLVITSRAHSSSRSMINGWFALVLLIVAMVATSEATSFKMSRTVSVQGTITDWSGANLENALMRPSNTATKVQHGASTQTNVVLEVGSSIAVDARMTVGGMQQHIETEGASL